MSITSGAAGRLHRLRLSYVTVCVVSAPKHCLCTIKWCIKIMLIIASLVGMTNYYIDIANKHDCNCIVNFLNIVIIVMGLGTVNHCGTIFVRNVAH